MRGQTFNSFTAVAEAMGIKPRKVDIAKQEAEQKKLCKCAKCGGQMDYVRGSNVLMCNCEITKDEKTFPCGNIRYLSAGTAAYAAKLFA